MPCPTDCLLSEWTSWGDCSTICGPGVHNRTRKVLRPSMNAGRPCEDMVQYKVCNKPCDTFQWFTGGWSECQLIGADQERGCGTGDQYRHVRCMQLQPDELPTEVSDMFCDPIIQPADVNACHVACPGDCVLGPWSDWSECYKPCESDRERQRTRSILRAPQSNAATCPQLIEVQPCRLNVTCFTYSWRWTDYSSCLPLGGSPCGEGVQSRAVYCLRSDGRPVADRVHLEWWGGTVQDINVTWAKLGKNVYSYLACIRLAAVTYPFGKGKATALKTLLAGEFNRLADVLVKVDDTSEALTEAATDYFTTLYGQSPGTSLESARF
uniref:Spondin-like TSP1 domain-containing protein n=1 Tax=Timema monikensis TaxID=170555 RepID=A0A7R9E2V4_9NEOP|nr:unnamed protein product [Timema monikensis]